MSYQITRVVSEGGKTILTTRDGWALIDQYQQLCLSIKRIEIATPQMNARWTELVEQLMVRGIFTHRDDFFTLWRYDGEPK